MRDNVFCIFQYGENKVDDFKEFLNKIEPRIQWTHEVQEDGVLNFMDLSIWCNEEGK